MNVSEQMYKVQVKRGNKWTEFDTARFQISVGQEYHEGEKLRASLLWARTRPSIRKVIICVNDTLQRHNLEMRGVDPAIAFAATLEAGRAWIARNRDAIDMLPDHEIIRWEEWRQDARTPALLAQMTRMYGTDAAFTQDVDEEVESFWQRAQKRGEDGLDLERFREHSTRYLLEECAVFKLMFERDQAVDIYPGSTLLPCKLGPNNNLGARGYTRIGFSRAA